MIQIFNGKLGLPCIHGASRPTEQVLVLVFVAVSYYGGKKLKFCKDFGPKFSKLGFPHKPEVVPRTTSGPQCSLGDVGSKLYCDLWP